MLAFFSLLAQATDAAHVSVPLGWVLAALGGLAATISALAGTIFVILNSRISAQAVVIRSQQDIINGMQGEIKNMSTGCGASGCFWSNRRILLPAAQVPTLTPDA